MNQSWSNKNIARSIMFGQSYLYVNTGLAGEFTNWHKFNFATMTLDAEAKTFNAIGGSGENYTAPTSGLEYPPVAGWNFSQTKGSHGYSPIATLTGAYNGVTGKFLNGKSPAWGAYAAPVFRPCGVSLINGSYMTVFHATKDYDLETGNIYSRRSVYVNDVTTNNPVSSVLTFPPITSFRTRVIRDRFYLQTVETSPGVYVRTYKDALNSGYSRAFGMGHPSLTTQIYTSNTFCQTAQASKAVIVRGDYYTESGSTRFMQVELCEIPANAPGEVFAPTKTVSVGLSDMDISTYTDTFTVYINPTFTQVRIAYPKLMGSTQWVYQVVDINFETETYVKTSVTIGYHLSEGLNTNMVCSGILWMDMDELTFGVLDDQGMRIVKNGVTVLTTPLPTGMVNSVANKSILVNTWQLNTPRDSEYGGHLALDKGKNQSLGYFLYTVVARKNDTFMWVDNGSSAKPSTFRLLCGNLP